MSRKITKTVFGVYVLEDDEIIAAKEFSRNEAVEQLLGEHLLEKEYADAEHVVLPIELIAELADVSVEEVRKRQVNVSQVLTRDQIRDAGARDQLLVQAVRALEDLDEINNDMSERIRPWFAIHFPELEEHVSDNEEFAEQVATEANRENMVDQDLGDDSTGMDIDETDARMMSLFAAQLSNGYAVRNELEQYVELIAQEVSPNLSALLDGLLAARLISLAGSLEKLAKMPASTIQVLGAEKAMFRHMKGEGSAPKHGVLFMHPFVQNVSRDRTGEIARALANKAAIAARLDQYGGEYKGEELREEVRKRLEDLQ